MELEVLKKARELGETLQNCETFIELAEAQAEMEADETCLDLLQQMNDAEQELQLLIRTEDNPTSEKVTIECPGMTLIEVYGMDGKLVQRIQVEGDAYQLDGLEIGIYTLRILSGGDIFVRRIIKTN